MHKPAVRLQPRLSCRMEEEDASTVAPAIIDKLLDRVMKVIGESLTDCSSVAMLSLIELERRNTVKLKLQENVALVLYISEHRIIPARCSPCAMQVFTAVHRHCRRQ